MIKSVLITILSGLTSSIGGVARAARQGERTICRASSNGITRYPRLHNAHIRHNNTHMGNLAATHLSRMIRSKAPDSDAPSTGLADALFTTTRQRLLALLFGQPGRSFFASELIQLTGSGSGAVQRELKRFSSCGLVSVTPVGRQKHYQANPACPVFEEMSGIVRKTLVLTEPIRRAATSTCSSSPTA